MTTRPTVRRTAPLLLAISFGLAACGGSSSTPSPVPTAAPTDSASPTDSVAPSARASVAVVPDSPIAGVITNVDSQGLDQVKGFTIRTNTGDTVAFTLGQLDNGDEFPPGHLKEHQASGAPVFVFFKNQNGQLVVYHIEDAP